MYAQASRKNLTVQCQRNTITGIGTPIALVAFDGSGGIHCGCPDEIAEIARRRLRLNGRYSSEQKKD